MDSTENRLPGFQEQQLGLTAAREEQRGDAPTADHQGEMGHQRPPHVQDTQESQPDVTHLPVIQSYQVN